MGLKSLLQKVRELKSNLPQHLEVKSLEDMQKQDKYGQ